MRSILSALAALMFLCFSAHAADIKATVDGTDAFKSYFGIWKGDWHVSGIGILTYDAKVVVCMSPKFLGKGGQERFGWMNSYSESFRFKGSKSGTSFITDLLLANGTMTFKITLPAGEEDATVKFAGEDQLRGSVAFKAEDSHTDTRPAEGTVTLKKIQSLVQGKHCPPSTKWPAS